ncbi:MAG: histidine kinase [Actinomycetota bacterium]
MLRRLAAREPSGDTVQVLASLNELSHSLRQGFTPAAARRIAETGLTLFEARAVAVTIDDALAASAGDRVDWAAEVERHARTVLERRRTAKPTLYETTIGRDQSEVAVSVLGAEALALGTIHVLPPEGRSARVRELKEYTDLVSTQLQLSELEWSRTYAAEAELRALRAQISPHFLHNSLTAIAGLVNTDPPRARSLIVTFAGFLRATFRTQTDLTTVAEELRLVEAYLELEAARFGDRFATTLDIAPEVLPVRLPFLTVQPLVENAIRHGLERRPGRGELRITGLDGGPEVAIVVEDDGVGIDPDQLQRALSGHDTTTHVGILAADTRLRKTFGPEYGLTIETGADAGTSVTMRLPKNSAHRPPV